MPIFLLFQHSLHFTRHETPITFHIKSTLIFSKDEIFYPTITFSCTLHRKFNFSCSSLESIHAIIFYLRLIGYCYIELLDQCHILIKLFLEVGYSRIFSRCAYYVNYQYACWSGPQTLIILRSFLLHLYELVYLIFKSILLINLHYSH